jgi:hypothetical protein
VKAIGFQKRYRWMISQQRIFFGSHPVGKIKRLQNLYSAVRFRPAPPSSALRASDGKPSRKVGQIRESASNQT